MGSVAGSTTQNQDLRSAQTGGLYVGPGAAVPTGGGVAITVQGGTGQSGASPSFAGAQFGLTGADTKSILDSMMSAQAGQRQDLLGLTSTIQQSSAAQSKALGDIVSATQAPTQTTLSSFLPFALVGLFLLMMFKGR